MTQYATEKSLAPDIDPRWAEEFILTARLEEIPGDVIGDTLGEVNDHCRSANESALEAFGPARDYVEQIAADVKKVKSPSILILLGPAFLQIVGVVLCLQGVYGLASGTSHPLDWATTAVFGIVGVLLLCAEKPLAFVLRLIVQKPVLGAATFGLLALLCCVLFSIPMWWSTPAVPIHSSIVLCIGIAAILIGTILEIGFDSFGGFDDPLIVAGQKDKTPEKKSKLSWLSSGYAIICAIVGSIIIMIFA